MSQHKLHKLNTKELNPLEKKFRAFLETRLVGQPEAVAALGRAYRTGLNPVANTRRPRAVLLFAGPSRSGKSYSVECGAEYCHGSPDAMIELEGGELQKEHEVMKLTGAPPSYIGYKAPPENQSNGEKPKFDPSAKLAAANLEASRRGSQCPIVWIRINEIEKAHQALFDLLLGGTDNGKINLGNNQQVNLGNCIIVMTSNLGMAELQKKSLGFLRREEKTVKDVKSAVDDAMFTEFRPEFRNRIDEVVIFNPLSREQVRKVVDFEVARLQERIHSKGPRGHFFTIVVDEKAKDFILDQADNTNGGVADMKRTLKRHLEDHLGNELLKGTIKFMDTVHIVFEDGEETLSLYIEEKEGIVIPTAEQVDMLDLPCEPDSPFFHRKVRRAALKAERSEKELFEVALLESDLEALADETSILVDDMKELFGVAIVDSGCRWEKPFVFKATVRAIEDQMKLLKVKYPELGIVRKDTATRENS